MLHARYARAMLGPSERRISKLEKLSTAGAIDWSDEWPHTTNAIVPAGVAMTSPERPLYLVRGNAHRGCWEVTSSPADDRAARSDAASRAASGQRGSCSPASRSAC